MPLPPKTVRDKTISTLLATRCHVAEPCVFVNCSQSLPQLANAYKGRAIPQRAVEHALCQAWHGVISVCKEIRPREIVLAHVNGEIRYVVHARDWIEVHGKRVIFELNWLPRSHPYRVLIGLDISTAIGAPHPLHSAFLFR